MKENSTYKKILFPNKMLQTMQRANFKIRNKEKSCSRKKIYFKLSFQRKIKNQKNANRNKTHTHTHTHTHNK